MNEDSQQPKIFGILMNCLHYSDVLEIVIQLNPGRPLSQVPVLSYDTVLSNFKPIVTTYPY